MPARIKVEPNEKYWRLTLLMEVEKKGCRRQFLCLCDCGNELVVRFTAIRAGETKSCGCLRDEQNRKAALTHGLSKHNLFRRWHDIGQRCHNPNNKTYKHYGGRGIKVCEEWGDYEKFYNWSVENGYKKELSIERIDVNGDYCPENCMWATIKEQSRNRRNNVFYKFNGQNMCISDWAKHLDLGPKTLVKRLKKWSVDRALSEPVNIIFRNRGKKGVASVVPCN